MNDLIKQDALIKFNQAINVIGEKLDVLVVDSQKIQKIEETADSTRANEILSFLRAGIKSVDGQRLGWTKPFRDMVIFVNNEVTNKLVSARGEERRLTQIIGVWNAEVERKYREDQAKREVEEQRRLKIQEAHKAKGHEVKETITPVPAPVPVKVRDVTKTRRDINFEIIDFYKIPQQYLKPNWQEDAIDKILIKQAIREGKDIPGVKALEPKVTIVT